MSNQKSYFFEDFFKFFILYIVVTLFASCSLPIPPASEIYEDLNLPSEKIATLTSGDKYIICKKVDDKYFVVGHGGKGKIELLPGTHYLTIFYSDPKLGKGESMEITFNVKAGKQYKVMASVQVNTINKDSSKTGSWKAWVEEVNN